MRDFLEGGERQEAAGSLDRVEGSEDASKEGSIFGVLLEFD